MTLLNDTAQTSKLSALVRLLDDDAPVVREAVSRELAAYGSGLGRYLHEEGILLDPFQWSVLRHIMFDVHQRALRSAWPEWLKEDTDAGRLEKALSLLADFQNGPQYRPSLRDSLDLLARECAAAVETPTHADVARLLFVEKQFRSATESEEDADAANLTNIIEHRCGHPLGLVCLFILICRRLDLDATGCNWPGAFYARFYVDDVLYVADCGGGGMVIAADELLRLQGPSREAAEAVLALDVDAVVLVRRIVNTLAFAYRRSGETDSSLLMLDLLRALERSSRHGFAGSASH